MKLYHKNPREITETQFSDLAKWLEELGDLSGFTHNIPTDEIICGNQRSRVVDINKCEIKIIEKLDEPDDQGTIALGFIIWKNHKYAYRAVVWDEKQCEMANIIANKAGGSFDFDTLANEFDLDDLQTWGFSDFELGIVTDINYDEEWEGMPEFKQEDLTPVKSIMVHFKTTDAIEDFSELLDQSLTLKTKSIWYPEAERADLSSETWQDES